MRIFITGVNGFVGPYVVQACLSHYPSCTIFGFASHSGLFLQSSQITHFTGDITDSQQIAQAVDAARPDVIIHLAAQSSVAVSWQDPHQTFTVNVIGTLNLLEAAKTLVPTSKIVLVGSGEQYGIVPVANNPISEECSPNPANPYAISKVTQDMIGKQYFTAFGLPIFRTRSFNHIGPEQAATFVVANFCQQVARIESGIDEPIIYVGNLSAQRDFLPVINVVDAYLHLVDEGIPGEAYNIGSGISRSIESILHAILLLSHVPISIHVDQTRLRNIDSPLLVADIQKIQSQTHWKPTLDIMPVLEDTLNYWRETVQNTINSIK